MISYIIRNLLFHPLERLALALALPSHWPFLRTAQTSLLLPFVKIQVIPTYSNHDITISQCYFCENGR